MLPFTQRIRRKTAQQHAPTIQDGDSDEGMHEDVELEVREKSTDSNTAALVQNLRSIVRSYLDSHMYESALFWADKVVSLTEGLPIDVFWMAQCMYYLKQYHRAAFSIQSRDLHKTHLMCRYLAAKCLMDAKEFASALILLTPEGQVKNSGPHTDGTRGPVGVERRRSTHTPSPLDTDRNDGTTGLKEHNEPPDKCHAGLDSVSTFARMDWTEVVDANLLPHHPPKRSSVRSFFNAWCGSDLPLPELESPESAILYLKGCVYEALGNRSFSAQCFKHALIHDVYCYDAFEALIQHQMLASYEEKQLLRSLPFSKQCQSKAEEAYVIGIYEQLLKKYHSVPAKSSVKIHSVLINNLDMRAAKAEERFYACAFTECHEITSKILLEDPYHSACLPIHIACLVELKRGNDLFQLAHELLELRPDLAVSWFAVGCYYYLKGKIDQARRYLNKATTLDKLFGPAWLAYGHTFAVENEHDQAMAAYFKSSQLMKGCHLPQLYTAIECGLTTNFKLADKFLRDASVIAPSDPFVIHELGVLAFQNLEYEKAEDYFEKALDKVKDVNEPIMTSKWEPLYNNLGHVCRKLKKYEKALKYHYHALILVPRNPSTYASIGFIQAITGKLAESAESFHKSLSLRRDDAFSTTMLNYVMEQLGHEPFPCEEFTDEDMTLPAPTTSTPARQATPATSPTDTESVASITPPDKGSSPPRSINEEMDIQETFSVDTS